ncbi:hypothetical protein L0U88_12195 [Flavihumibacter sp. RY-1]|uniref:Uncharacterized protein n=1 Tax=Flavihumibacter fluminis TaxID=2909236 RepID=A0ABS9BK62_9BACT|nr:hypothetical protein [Flavihumibacter fluminis]MCF1715388.1 hypothetical protein [Flavihumibacter fluminis]
MSNYPDFIMDYHTNTHDDAASKELLKLAADYKKALAEVEKGKNAQYGVTVTSKTVKTENIYNNYKQHEIQLKEQYLKKAREIAKPHMHKTTYEELNLKHELESEKQQRLDKEAKEQDRTKDGKQVENSRNQERTQDRKDELSPELKAEFERLKKSNEPEKNHQRESAAANSSDTKPASNNPENDPELEKEFERLKRLHDQAKERNRDHDRSR